MVTFFSPRALVTSEACGPQAAPVAEWRRIFLSAVEDPGESQSWGVRGAVDWTKQLKHKGAETAKPVGREGCHQAGGSFAGTPTAG